MPKKVTTTPRLFVGIDIHKNFLEGSLLYRHHNWIYQNDAIRSPYAATICREVLPEL